MQILARSTDICERLNPVGDWAEEKSEEGKLKASIDYHYR